MQNFILTGSVTHLQMPKEENSYSAIVEYTLQEGDVVMSQKGYASKESSKTSNITRIKHNAIKDAIKNLEDAKAEYKKLFDAKIVDELYDSIMFREYDRAMFLP